MSLFTSFTIVGRSDEILEKYAPAENRIAISSNQQAPMIFPQLPMQGPSQSDGILFSPQNLTSQLYIPPACMVVPQLPIPLSTSSDCDNLSPYQCLLREHIELFETDEGSLSVKAQGRNNPIQIGQVGIRCRHCVPVTPTSQLKTGAIQFSRSVDGIYQVALKMSRSHFPGCQMMPETLKKRLLELKELPRKRSKGRQYWKETLEAQGLVEDGKRLRFDPHSRQELVFNKAFDHSLTVFGSSIL